MIFKDIGVSQYKKAESTQGPGKCYDFVEVYFYIKGPTGKKNVMTFDLGCIRVLGCQGIKVLGY